MFLPLQSRGNSFHWYILHFFNVTAMDCDEFEKTTFACNCSYTCVKAFAFQSPNIGPFEAQYKRQSLLHETAIAIGKNVISQQL